MKRFKYPLLVTLIALTVCGCVPKRLFWSPDGQRGAIVGEYGLRLFDAEGKLSEVIAKDVEIVAWLPDSQAFIAASKSKAGTWDEAAQLLAPERREQLIRLAEPLLQEVLAYQSADWGKFKPRIAAEVSDGELAALLLYIREHRREGLPELGELWKKIEKASVDFTVLQMYDVSGLQATPGPVLVHTLDVIGEIRIAPGGKAVACVQMIRAGEHSDLRLSVLPVGGGELRTVAEPVAAFPDWRGRDLVYATTPTKPSQAGDALQLGMLAARTVLDKDGALLEKFEDCSTSIGVLFWPFLKIRCLRDGQVLFSAMEVALPAAQQDMPQRPTLFCIDPDKRPTVARVIPRAAESELPKGLELGFFEISPDEKRVAITGPKGQVVVLSLASGEVTKVLDVPEFNPETQAAWRTSQELSLSVPPGSGWGSPQRPEIALWSGSDQARCLSCSWPVVFATSAPQPASGASLEELPLEPNSMAIQIEALVDGKDRLIIRGGSLKWEHLEPTVPGRHDERNEPTVISTKSPGAPVTLDRVKWFPTWYDLEGQALEDFDRPAVSSEFTGLRPALPAREVAVKLVPLQARGRVEIVQQPAADNQYTLILEFDDGGEGGSGDYRVQLIVSEPDAAATRPAGADN